MRKLILLLLAFALLAACGWAQTGSNQNAGFINSTQCVSVPAGNLTIGSYSASGTWTGTLTAFGVVGQGTPVSLGSQTGNGSFTLSISGYTLFEVCGNTVGSGYAFVQVFSSIPSTGSVLNCTGPGNSYYASAGIVLSCDTSIIDNGSGSLYFFGSLSGPFLSALNVNNGEFGVNASVGSGWNATGLKLGSTGVIQITSGALSAGTVSGISGGGTGIIDFGTGAAGNTGAHVKAAGYTSAGTTFTSSGGCTEGTLTGGATAGKFTTSGSTSCSTTVTMGNSLSAPNGWSCMAIDLTTIGDVTNPHQTASTQTTATFATGTIVANDVIQFSCIGY